MKRILIAAGIYPPEGGGPATYAYNLSHELIEQGHQVIVVKFRDFSGYPKLLKHAAYFWRVVRMGRKSDVIYAQDPVSVGLPAMCAAFLLRKRFMLRTGGDYAWEQGRQRFGLTLTLDEFMEKTQGYPWQVYVLRLIQSFVGKRAEKLIVPSQYLKKVALSWGVPEKKIIIVPNSSEGAEHLLTDKETARKQLFLKDNPILVSVGRLVPWKGMDVLVSVFKKVLEEYPGARLYIVGDGPERNTIVRKIEELGLGEKVALTGNLPQKDVLLYMKAADAFVLNTAYEGFSHVILEALWLETPVVSTNVCGNPELIESGKEGILVPFNDFEKLYSGIMTALDDIQARLFKDAGKKKAEQFKRNIVLQKSIDLL